ncbi:putative dehydrogenase [Halanaerobium saccharolyticum]|uniref:Putative dehydrogenase n=1 Tax=Halanaerobium saccharolyticum TaxID=43595 RepID=A0A4R6LHH6_9FIRM|nr:Gfo/Idh/MocA family oxidoreductase [Halanaerobium saccharolyticum]TDO83364.1 putative dehydrogenase [Halanaerobium saccharolyticum]
MQKLNVGFLGAGEMARIHAGILRDMAEVEITAVTSRHQSSAADLINSLGFENAAAYTDFDQMLAEKDLDLLYICLPPAAHQGQLEKAARKGIHIFIEKPIAINEKKAEEMLKAVQETGVVSQVGYHYRFAKGIQKLKKLIDSGQAGRTALLQGYYFCNSLHSNWWRQLEKSGGQIYEQVIHLYDLALHLFGDYQSAEGMLANLCHQETEGYTIEDNSLSLIQFKSGAMGSIAGSNCAVPGSWKKALTVICENLTVEFENIEKAVFQYHQEEEVETEVFEGREDLYYRENRDFIDAVIEKREARVPISEGLKAIKLITEIKENNKKRGNY